MTGAGPQVTYGYDSDGNLTSVAQSLFGTVQIALDADNRRSSVTFPNTASQTYGYDSDSRVTSITYKQGNTQLGNLIYTYDTGGRRTEVSGGFAGTVFPFYWNNNQQSYTYNTDGSPKLISGGTGSGAGSFGISNDNGGDVTNDLGMIYLYNERSQVKEMDNASPGIQEKFTYDPFGRRVRTSVALNGGSPSITNFLYDGANIVNEIPTIGTATTVMNGLAADDRFARYGGGVTRYYLTDAVGSVVALTDTTGAVQTRYTYGPFGQTANSGTPSDNPYQFAGRELDPNGGFGIYYFRARYMDTLELNRFMARDPQGLSGGNYATLYAYVGNSPLNGTDSTGAWVVGGVPSIGLPGGGSGWWGVPNGIGGGPVGGGGGSPDANAVAVAQLDLVSSGNGQQLALLAGLSGYTDTNVTIGFGPWLGYLGLTGGIQSTSYGYYPYGGVAVVYPPGPSVSVTLGDSVTPGVQVGLQGAWQGVAGQVGYALGSGVFWELGTGFPAGLSLTGYYVGGPFPY